MDIELIRGNVKVELENIGEGWSGDYDPDDPDDEPLLRFTVSKKDADGEWQQVDDASYCTQIRADTPEPRLREILNYLMDEVGDSVESGSSIKRRCEWLSWIKA